MTDEATQTDFRPLASKNAQFDRWAKGEILLEQQLAKWKFFPPPADIVEEILELNEKLVDNHLNQEEGLESDARESNELADQDGRWFKRVFKEASEILFRDSGRPVGNGSDEGESFSYYQSVVGERIYNHLAMLARSPYAKQGGSFSIREELTEELAGKIGLGLYLRLDENDALREKCNRVLFNLALSFQNWLIERKEVYPAPWGIICTPRKSEMLPDLHSQPRLIMTPDVEVEVLKSIGTFVQGGG